MPSRTAFVLAAAIAAVPTTTFADSSGSAGSVISVTVLESSSDDYGSYRGKIVIREGTEPSATQTEYRWGGTICANRNLSESNIALLVEALRGRSDTQVLPRYKMGQAGIRCLVSFTLQEPVYVAR